MLSTKAILIFIKTRGDVKVKIFIDTNIFLDMYRSNLQQDIKTIMKFLYQNKGYFITTEQSVNEFSRNRRKILSETLNSFKNQTNIDKGSSTFLRSLTSFKKYDDSLKRFCEQRNRIIEEIQDKIANPQKDDIFSKFQKLCKHDNVILSTDKIIDSASRRKLSGNPPTSDKYTCGDEIIWESLLAYETEHKEDLTVVSKDKTFADNSEFLCGEYSAKTGKSLTICQDIIDAYRTAGVELSRELEQAQENLKWTDVIITALTNLGGEATLTDIYNEASDILYYNDCRSKMENKAKESTIRGILQRFSSDIPSAYNGKKDLFHQVSEGVWALKQ